MRNSPGFRSISPTCSTPRAKRSAKSSHRFTFVLCLVLFLSITVVFNVLLSSSFPADSPSAQDATAAAASFQQDWIEKIASPMEVLVNSVYSTVLEPSEKSHDSVSSSSPSNMLAQNLLQVHEEAKVSEQTQQEEDATEMRQADITYSEPADEKNEHVDDRIIEAATDFDVEADNAPSSGPIGEVTVSTTFTPPNGVPPSPSGSTSLQSEPSLNTTVPTPHQRSRGPLDANGNPLTNGAGVYFTEPFNGTCRTREARLLAPRHADYNRDTHVVVIGIISLDNKDHYTLRMAQRDTWLTYKDVATVKNGFNAPVLVEYVVGLAHENQYRFSEELLSEAATHQDVMGVKVKEVKRNSKSLLTTGKYGRAAEVMMSLKTLAFYCYVEKAYPNTKFVIKADDDQFMRIPVLLRTALHLPATGVIWGTMNRPRPTKQDSRRFCGTSGMLVGLSHDVLSLVNHYEPVQKFGRINPNAPVVPGIGPVTLKWIYLNTGLYAEDIVAAQVLDATRMLPQTQYIHFYNERACRLHNHNADKRGYYVYFVNPYSMVIHHANRTEQMEFMELFPESNVYDVSFARRKKRGERHCYERAFFQEDVCSLPAAKEHL